MSWPDGTTGTGLKCCEGLVENRTGRFQLAYLASCWKSFLSHQCTFGPANFAATTIFPTQTVGLGYEKLLSFRNLSIQSHDVKNSRGLYFLLITILKIMAKLWVKIPPWRAASAAACKDFERSVGNQAWGKAKMLFKILCN